MPPFSWSHKVYFGDTDAAGVVHHATYVYWFEAARIEWLDALGCSYVKLQNNKIGFVPVDIQLNYKHPLIFGDHFTIKTQLIERSKVSLTVLSQLFRTTPDKPTLELPCTEAKVKLVCMDESVWKIIKIPEWVEKELIS